MISIYRLADKSGQLLYVGITNSLGRRLSQHEKSQPWWSEVASVTSEHASVDRAEALAIEREAIEAEQPLYNKTHGRCKMPVPYLVGDGSIEDLLNACRAVRDVELSPSIYGGTMVTIPALVERIIKIVNGLDE